MSTATLLETGLDYITLSAVDGLDMHRLYAIGIDLLEGEFRLGNKRTAISPHGYNGHQCGKIFIGRGDTGTLLRASSDMAVWAFDRLKKLDVRCTRIDFQATWQLERYDPKYGKREYNKANGWRSAHNKRNLSHMRHLDGNGLGDTVMIGSRSSPRYGRLYDKQAESGDDRYEKCWRWEVEYKSECAQNAWDALLAAKDSNSYSKSVVRSQFANWGFDTSFMSADSTNVLGPKKSDTDVARKLRWIQMQCLPSMQYIVDNGGGVQLKMMLDTLDV